MWAAEIVREGAYPIGQALIRLLTQLGCTLLLLVYTAQPPPEFWPMILRASLIIWISLEAVVALFVRRPLPKLGGALVVFIYAFAFSPTPSEWHATPSEWNADRMPHQTLDLPKLGQR